MGFVINATLRPLYRRARTPVSTVQEEGWAPGPEWTGADTLAPPGFDPAHNELLYWLRGRTKENHKIQNQDTSYRARNLPNYEIGVLSTDLQSWVQDKIQRRERERERGRERERKEDGGK